MSSTCHTPVGIAQPSGHSHPPAPVLWPDHFLGAVATSGCANFFERSPPPLRRYPTRARENRAFGPGAAHPPQNNCVLVVKQPSAMRDLFKHLTKNSPNSHWERSWFEQLQVQAPSFYCGVKSGNKPRNSLVENIIAVVIDEESIRVFAKFIHWIARKVHISSAPF